MRRVCESVAVNLEGRRLAGFTRISTAVRAAVEEALHRILTPRRSVDVLREVPVQACLLCYMKVRVCRHTWRRHRIPKPRRSVDGLREVPV